MAYKKQEIKKHVATIHCSNTLSLLQRKISNVLLFKAYDQLLLKDEHEITIRQLCDLIGYKGNNHGAIKDALRGLITTLIEWNVADEQDGQEDWTASSALASIQIKGALCRYAYSPRMKELLHSPIIYGKINLTIQSKFKSNYGLALYENCVRYRGLSYTKWFRLDIFRRLMGVPDNQYLIFRDFKKRVLEKSVTEVNAYSDLQVAPELRKIGRTVTEIRFRLTLLMLNLAENSSNLDQEISLTSLPVHKPIIEKLVNRFHFDRTKANTLLEAYGENYLEEKIRTIEHSPNFQTGKIKNITGYFITVLKQNCQEGGHGNQKTNKFYDEQLEEECQQRNQKQIYNKAIAKSIDEKFSNLSAKAQDELKSEFTNYLIINKQEYILEKYKKSGLSNAIVKIIFRDYLKRVAVIKDTAFPNGEEIN